MLPPAYNYTLVCVSLSLSSLHIHYLSLKINWFVFYTDKIQKNICVRFSKRIIAGEQKNATDGIVYIIFRYIYV